jgi:hypothetical protein
MAPGQQFCSACGTQVADVNVLSAQGRVQRHVQLLAILWFVYSFITLLGAGALFLVANVIFVEVGRRSDLRDVPNFLHPLLSFISVLILAKALVGFAAGWGLLQRDRWARPLALVLAFLALLSVPFGTALGIYTLWVLLPGSAGDEYGALANPPPA